MLLAYGGVLPNEVHGGMTRLKHPYDPWPTNKFRDGGNPCRIEERQAKVGL